MALCLKTALLFANVSAFLDLKFKKSVLHENSGRNPVLQEKTQTFMAYTYCM
jgi:hypothetical protein